MPNPLTAADILTMPITELRERVDLAERLAIAARHSGNGGSAASPSSTASANTAQAGAAGKTQAGASGKTTAPTATPKPATPAPAPVVAPAADDFAEDALSGSAGDALGDFDVSGGGDDMLAGFTAEMSPEDARAKAVEIGKAVIGRRDTNELAKARDIMQKYGVSKVGEVALDKAGELYNDFHTAFPND